MTRLEWAIAYDLTFGIKQAKWGSLLEGESQMLNKMMDDPEFGWPHAYRSLTDAAVMVFEEYMSQVLQEHDHEQHQQ